MTRYNDEVPMNPEYAAELGGYREGVDRVLRFLDSLNTREATDGAALIDDAISKGLI